MLDGSFLTNKYGALPAWAWMGLGLGAAVGISSWRSNKAASAAATGSGDAVTQMYKLPESVQPTYTFIDQDHTDVTLTQSPPTGGRGRGPRPAPIGTPAPVPAPVVPPPAATPTPVIPVPTPAAVPPPPAPAGLYATVVKYFNGQPKGTPSTLWGIAERYYGNGATWAQIWNAPQNAGLRSQRGAANLVRPGDRVWVPTK